MRAKLPSLPNLSENFCSTDTSQPPNLSEPRHFLAQCSHNAYLWYLDHTFHHCFLVHRSPHDIRGSNLDSVSPALHIVRPGQQAGPTKERRITHRRAGKHLQYCTSKKRCRVFWVMQKDFGAFTIFGRGRRYSRQNVFLKNKIFPSTFRPPSTKQLQKKLT